MPWQLLLHDNQQTHGQYMHYYVLGIAIYEDFLPLIDPAEIFPQ